MSQSNSSSSSFAQDLPPHVPGTASSSAQASPPVAKSGSFRNYLLLFALLALVAIMFQRLPIPMPKDSGGEFTSSEPKVTPVVSQSAESSALSYANKQVGESFKYGRYPHGADGEVKPIIWRVLEREPEHLLVISEQCLDCQPYHKQFCDITWPDCHLRHWLNDKFMSEAFNEQERKCVLKTSVVNNTGPNTEDYVFLLSVDEANSLFANDSARRAMQTQYAEINGVHICDGGCCWWLRSRGSNTGDAAYVRVDGCVCADGRVSHTNIAVRPAIKLSL